VSSIAQQPYPWRQEFGAAMIERTWTMVLDEQVHADAREGAMTWRERTSFHGGGETLDIILEYDATLDESERPFVITSSLVPGSPTPDSSTPRAPQLTCTLVDEAGDPTLRCRDQHERAWVWIRE
jgi:hypothetical protein